jgi:hypothetical protein
MREVWLRNNRRALALGAVLPSLLLVVGLALAGVLAPVESTLARVAGVVLAAATVLALGLLARESRRPRLAYERGELLVYLEAGAPYRVPIEVVECFLLGQAPAALPGRRNARRETLTLVVRLAESATDWAQRPARPALGAWCGGQITLRGTWCEPLTLALLRRLNARLAEVQQAAARQGEPEPARGRRTGTTP